MNYQVIGDTLPAVEFQLEPGESIYTQSGGMTWMSDGIRMDSNMKGGFGKSIGRMFSGESLFMATYTSERPGASVAFAATVPGNVVPIDLGQTPGLICQKGAFLCAEPTVELSITLTKKFSAGLFGGEGFILERLAGSGMAFLEVDGDQVVKELAPGEVIKIDTGNVVAFESTVSYEIETVKNLKNIFFSGEGLFLTKLVGPGRVILQTQNLHDFASRIAPFLPAKN